MCEITRACKISNPRACSRFKGGDSYERFEQLFKTRIIQAYNNYIIDFYDEHDCDSCPVCLNEFIDNDLEFYI